MEALFLLLTSCSLGQAIIEKPLPSAFTKSPLEQAVLETDIHKVNATITRSKTYEKELAMRALVSRISTPSRLNNNHPLFNEQQKNDLSRIAIAQILIHNGTPVSNYVIAESAYTCPTALQTLLKKAHETPGPIDK